MFKDLTTRARAAMGFGSVVLALLASMAAGLSGLAAAGTLHRQAATRATISSCEIVCQAPSRKDASASALAKRLAASRNIV